MFEQMPNRLQPQMHVGGYKTYAISAPIATHTRPASCEEVGCLNFHNGWETRVPVDSELDGLVRASGRGWRSVVTEGGVNIYTFGPGTECFNSSSHRVPLDRPQLFVVRDGDWRGNDTGRVFKHDKPEHWVEDFANHQQKIADARNKG